MADIDFYQDDGDDSPEDGYGMDDGIDGDDTFGTDDNLTPLQKLEKYMESDNVYTRQMVARGLLDTLRTVGDSEEHTTAVLSAMVRLSQDSDPIVRSELMEQVPHIAVYCEEQREVFPNAVPVYVLPMVVRYLNDANNQVRKTSQAALLVLLEQDLVATADIEEQVVNVILDLASPDSLDDYRTEAVALMSKMAPLLGNEMTERVFLNRFCEMCCDPLFHVRKVCAANFGDMCTVVGQTNTEQQLLPKFYYLCEDGVWGVRKACAECFMAVSCSCSPEVRKNELASLFVNLLCDQSRWVRMAAFQQLGPFISTFADSDTTGITVDEEGNLTVHTLEQCAERIKSGEDCSLRETEDEEKQEKTATEDQVVPDMGNPSEESDRTSTDACSPEDKDGGSPEQEPTSSVESPIEASDSPQSLSGEALICDNTSPDDIVVEMDLSEDQSEKSQLVTIGASDMDSQQAVEKSIEEKRAEHYVTAETEPAESESIEDTEVSQDIENNNSSLLSEGGNQQVSSESVDQECSDKSSSSDNTQTLDDTEQKKESSEKGDENPESEVVKNDENDAEAKDSSLTEQSSNSKPGHVHIHLDNVNQYNAFEFWRTPLPEIDLDLDIVNGAPTNIHVTARVKEDEGRRVYASEMNVQVASEPSNTGTLSILSDSVSDLTLCDNKDSKDDSVSRSESVVEDSGVKIHTASVSTFSVSDETVHNISSTHVLGQHISESNSVIDETVQDLSTNNMAFMDEYSSPHSSLQDSLTLDDATLAQQQDIVPQSLLENYLGMIDPSRAQTVDTEISKYCAYNLPAVAYTLGRNNWHCIKNLYDTLAADMQWKVRRTLAFSIHELAVILGEEITHRDLVPVFDGFLKDLDEVRIGILKHLADFLRLLNPDVRRQYLIKVQDFMNIDNQRNWRFRLELSEQLGLVSELFSAQEVSEHLLPLALYLAEDKVAEVRQDANRLISVMMRRLTETDEEKLVKYLTQELIQKFAQSQRWAGRQIYVQLCQAMLREEASSLEQFATDFMPSLLTLGSDPVPNVRIAVSKTLSSYILNRDYFTSTKNPHHEELLKLLHALQSDSDRDVRYFCSSNQETHLETTSDTLPV